MKKTIDIAAWVITGFWLVIFLISLFEYFFFEAPSNTEPLDAFMTRGVYFAFALFALMGAISSAIFKLSFKSAFTGDGLPKNALKKVAFGTSVLVNILFYIIFVATFSLQGNYVFIIILLWLLCMIATAVMLVIAKVMKPTAAGGESSEAEERLP